MEPRLSKGQRPRGAQRRLALVSVGYQYLSSKADERKCGLTMNSEILVREVNARGGETEKDCSYDPLHSNLYK